jgi:hypothetical protein
VTEKKKRRKLQAKFSQQTKTVDYQFIREMMIVLTTYPDEFSVIYDCLNRRCPHTKRKIMDELFPLISEGHGLILAHP